MATEPKTGPVIETVKMQDGRVVEFAGKRKLLKESTITAEGAAQVRLDWRNGETRLFTIPPAMLAKFACHGAEQKLGDEIAGLKDDKGNDADIDDCVLTVDELIDRLYAGEWGTKRDGNGMAGTSILLRALIEMQPAKPADEIRAWLKGKTHAEKTALRANPKVKPIVDRLEAEKATKKSSNVDTDALLNELG
jgi:hypothetical protein